MCNVELTLLLCCLGQGAPVLIAAGLSIDLKGGVSLEIDPLGTLPVHKEALV